MRVFALQVDRWSCCAEVNGIILLTFELMCYVAHRACYGVLRFIMESGAKGCEVVVSGKLRGQRAKSMKFVDGFMVHSGYPTREYIDSAVTHVHLRQGKKGNCSTTSDNMVYLDLYYIQVY